MNGKDIKNYIYENGLIPQILESIGCHNISDHGRYWTCANYNGDNKSAISVYNTEFINVINYTRDITNKGKYVSDIISLVAFNKEMSPFEAIKFICTEVGVDYYHDFDEDIPESLKITKLIYDLQEAGESDSEEIPLKKISEQVLSYYNSYVNDLFLNDGISYSTQVEFEIGYDSFSNRISIPIRSEIGDLVGVKGRLFKKADDILEHESKYLYIEPCNRSKILYGLNKTYDFIKSMNRCYIGESEKFVMQLWSMGYYNSVAIGGKKVTNAQIEKLSRLGVDLVFCFDKDVLPSEIEEISNNFIDGVNIYILNDKNNILKDKESPSDNKEKFEFMLENNLYKIK